MPTPKSKSKSPKQLIIARRIYKKVRKHLLKQGRRCVGPSSVGSTTERCLYRGPNDLQCAVGCLIKDWHYVPSLEGKGADDMFVIAAVEQSLGVELGSENQCLLERLQMVHDSTPPVKWRTVLEDEWWDFIVSMKWDKWEKV